MNSGEAVMSSAATAFASGPAPGGRTDELFGVLHRELTLSFPARQIAMLVDRGGRLVLFGQPTGTEIASAAMLLASVHVRLSSDHTYVSPAIPGAVLLRLLLPTDRGSILLAPVCDQGTPIGAIVIEGPSGHAFSAHDLTRLRAVIRSSEIALMGAA
jgi:hypothetical protein